MRRKAIIIGSPQLNGQPKLLGVEQDMILYPKFLQSNAGGAWHSTEIISLLQPKRAEVESVLKEEADYAFIVFAGHGYHHAQENLTFVCLNDNDEMSENELIASAPKQTIVIDACRELWSDPIYEGQEKVSKALDTFQRSQTYRNECRALFDQQISSAPGGRSIIYSCSVSESAGDTRQGGYFSYRFIAESTSWAETYSNQSQGARYISDIPDSFNLALARIKKERGLQTPQLLNGRRRTSFPFAVA